MNRFDSLVRYASRTVLAGLAFCAPAIYTAAAATWPTTLYLGAGLAISLLIAAMVVAENSGRRAMVGRTWRKLGLGARLALFWQRSGLRVDLATALFFVLAASTTASVLLNSFLVMIPGIAAATARPRECVCVGVGLWLASLATGFSVEWLTVLGYAYLVAGVLAHWSSAFALLLAKAVLAKEAAPQEVLA